MLFFSTFSFKIFQNLHFKNAFMTVAWSDPHEILSYDRMHNDSHGIGGKHILPTVLKYLKASGRNVLAELDKRFVFSFFNFNQSSPHFFLDSGTCLHGVA
jgi:hypothetical protein